MEKEKKKDYSIEEKSQKHLKTFSKIFYVIAKIMEVLVIIGIIGIVLAMIAIPFTTSNIKIIPGEEMNNVKIFNQDVYYKRSSESVELFAPGSGENSKMNFTDENNIKAFNKVFDYLENNNLTNPTIYIELELLLAVAILVIEVIILRKAYKFFKNIHNESTPFTEENVDLIKCSAKLTIYTYVIVLVMSIISNIAFGSTITIRITNILEILFMFLLAYIFEYGYNMQKDTKGMIYSE